MVENMIIYFEVSRNCSECFKKLPLFFIPSLNELEEKGWIVAKTEIDIETINDFIEDKNFTSAKLFILTNKLKEIDVIFEKINKFKNDDENFILLFKYKFTAYNYRKIRNIIAEVEDFNMQSFFKTVDSFYNEYERIYKNFKNLIAEVLNTFIKNLAIKNTFFQNQIDLEYDILNVEIPKIFKNKYKNDDDLITNKINSNINLTISCKCCINIHINYYNFSAENYNEFIEKLYKRYIMTEVFCPNLLKNFFEKVTY
jgi:hypothetical protein